MQWCYVHMCLSTFLLILHNGFYNADWNSNLNAFLCINYCLYNSIISLIQNIWNSKLILQKRWHLWRKHNYFFSLRWGVDWFFFFRTHWHDRKTFSYSFPWTCNARHVCKKIGHVGLIRRHEDLFKFLKIRQHPLARKKRAHQLLQTSKSKFCKIKNKIDSNLKKCFRNFSKKSTFLNSCKRMPSLTSCGAETSFWLAT